MWKRTLVGLGLVILAWSGAGWAQGCFWDDAAFFTTAAKPNVFLTLDRSGSMCWEPWRSGYPCANGNWIDCVTNDWGANSKIRMATDAIKMILDADSSGTVTDDDSLALNIRLGYGHYYNSGGEASGLAIPYNGDTIGTRYTKIWADASNQRVCGGTPMNRASWLSKELVKNTHRAEGPAWSCRKSFLILITDGEDTWGCGGSGSSGNPGSRRAGVNVCYTSNVNDTIPVFVIGFGATMPQMLKNELNWMALKGGTDNPMVPNTGDTTTYIPRNDGGTYQTCDNRAVADPGFTANPPDGYAFIAGNAADLRNALRAIFRQIQQSSGSTFSPPSVPANFTSASMLLVNNFDAKVYPTRWRGHLRAYGFYANGDLPILGGGGLDSTRIKWNAGELLRARNIAGSPRAIYTAFKTPSGYYLWPLNDTLVFGGRVRPESLGLAPTAAGWDSLRRIVNYMYYDSTAGAQKFGWLGDPFHSGPVDVGPPNPYFSTDSVYSDFVYNLRTLSRRPRRVYLQANDGMIHVFNGDSAVVSGGGREECAIVPNHSRTWLRDMMYNHDYNLDGPVISTHVLVPELNIPGNWEWEDWRTILVCGERTGGRNYYAVDITRPDLGVGPNYPKYLWEYGADSPSPEPNMGYTFGKATVCRVKDATHPDRRRYVAFLPGGYDCAQPGRGNFVLAVDAYNGTLLRKIMLGSVGVAAQVRPVDVNYDGFMDRLYVGDMAGSMWRIILDNPADRNGWYANRLFQPTIATYARPIYGEVSVAADFRDSLYVMWGTGDRNRPTDPVAQMTNAFFSVRDVDTSQTYDLSGGSYGLEHLTNASTGCNYSSYSGWYIDLYQSPTTFLEVFTNAVTVSDSVRVLGWTPTGSGNACQSAGAGNDTLLTFVYSCGAYKNREHVGSGIPPYELVWGVDRLGNVTTLLPNLRKRNLGYLTRGKFIRVWREVY